ncbi:MAG: histidine phosphatase family protein [Chthoniobacteraceae bacterium]
MTTFLLIRHASHDLLGKALAGRSDIPLNAKGSREAAQLAERLVSAEMRQCFSSPARRARETAEPIAAKCGVEMQIHHGIGEIDFGAWTGHTLLELESDPEWPVWVNRRSAAQPPDGETISAVQRRVMATLHELAPGGGTIALVSHGDVIKAALAHVLAMSLDHLERFDVAPASVSVVAMNGAWSRVESMNGSG